MSEEICFVEVLMQTYEPGDKVFQEQLENDCCDISWETASEEIPEVILAQGENKRREEEAEYKDGFKMWDVPPLAYEPDTLITKHLTIFSFRYFGQGFDESYSSGLEWEVHEMGADYIFEGWLDELKRLGNQILEDKKAMGHPRAGKVVRFITAWTYRSWQDSYNHEWDSEWELVGVVNPRDYSRNKLSKKSDLLSSEENVF